MKMLHIAIATFLATVLCAAIASAATLNTDVTLDKDVLTVGDVFADAGADAAHVLGPAPKPGNLLVLNTATLKHIAGSFNVAWAPSRGTETATIRSGAQPAQKTADNATMVKVPVLAAPLARDSVIAASDLIYIEVPSSQLKDDTALKESDLVGLSARGLIQPNQPISTNLIVAPKVIKRGDLVNLSLNSGQIALTSQGRALEDARLGGTVRVQNTNSQKIVQARVTGPQEATIEPAI